MKWYLNRKVNYFPFDIYSLNVGYTKNQWPMAGVGFNDTFYYYHNGYTTSYRGQTDLDNIVKYLQKNFNKKYVDEKGALIKSLVRNFLKLTRKTFKSKTNLKRYLNDFYCLQAELFGLFQIPEYCQLFLTGGDKELLIKFGLTRDYAAKRIIIAEKIYRSRLGKLIGLPRQISLMLLPSEVKDILLGSPPPVGLNRRKTFCLYTHRQKEIICWNKKADLLFKKIIKRQKTSRDQLKGQIAFRGKYRGRVYLALNEDDFKGIPNNSVLICSMTRYDIVKHLQKVKAIVTDQGGITCHAAIIARELKIPTIIGAYSATDVFTTGELVEVDANKGVIKKIGN